MSRFDGELLCAPAHHILDGTEYGSELKWAYAIVREAARYFEAVTAITGRRRGGELPSNVRVIEVGTDETGNFLAPAATIKFMYRYARAGLRQMRATPPAVVHHILPYALHRSVNPLWPFLKNVPFVIGPVQAAYPEVGHEAPVLGAGRRGAGVPLGLGVLRPFAPAIERLSHAVLRRADCIVAISDKAAEELSHIVDDDRVRIVPAGVDLDAFPFVRRSYNADRPIHLIAVSYFVPRKALDDILKAMALLQERGVAAELTIVGDGPDRLRIAALVDRMKLNEDVRLVGFVRNNEVGRILADADLFVSMSRAESFGTNLVEALSSGLPVISAANDGAREILANAEGGILVPVGDVEGLAVRVAELARSPGRLTRMSESARSLVERRFDWTRIGERYAQAYERALRRRGRRGT